MILEAGNLYHVYNQGNNKENIFINNEDYISFLRYPRKFVLPYTDVLCYCLMPNHFHFLLNTTKESVEKKKIGNIESTNIQNGFRILLSSYTRAFNTHMNRSGSLFRQKTKFKLIEGDEQAYVCFNYIHQNPMVARLCNKMENWAYSSFQDYSGMRNGSFCNRQIAYELIDLNEKTFYEDSYNDIPEFKINKLY